MEILMLWQSNEIHVCGGTSISEEPLPSFRDENSYFIKLK
jgi:hypothetical protein